MNIESESIIQNEITEQDRKLARQCIECRVCSKARAKQEGFAFIFVKYLEQGLCPACQAYEKVYGKKAHEPIHEPEKIQFPIEV